MKVTLDHVESIAKNIYTFWFATDSSPKYSAGQFIELRLPHEDKDKRGDKRWFTLSSSPAEPLLSITTKFATDNGSSFKKALKALQPGDEVNMSSPMGDFVLPKDASIPLVFVAGGIGSTPLRSMCKYIQDSGEAHPVKVIYNANSAEDIAFSDVFKKLGADFTIITGERLSADKILEVAGTNDDQYIYLSGPEPMIESLNKDLKNAGVNKKHINTDFFPGYEQI